MSSIDFYNRVLISPCVSTGEQISPLILAEEEKYPRECELFATPE